MTDVFCLYHWSPTTRRGQINKYGFRPSMWSVDGEWKPPYICFSEDPWLAWELSGKIHTYIKSWDLWQTWSDVPSGMEEIWDNRLIDDKLESYIKEYRVYERIYKRDIFYVATRSTA